MLTPVFEISQSADFITIIIKAPFSKISDTEIFIDDCEFKFYSKPYYLRLNLPGPITEDGRESAKYDSGAGIFTISVPKKHAGEIFEGLDMITQLLAPTGRTSAIPPNIEVLEIANKNSKFRNRFLNYLFNDTKPLYIGSAECLGDDEEFDWQIDQYPAEEIALSTEGPKYGFANRRCQVFTTLQEELRDIIDLKNADGVSFSDRHVLRAADEDATFDEEYYLTDLYESSDTIQELIDYTAPWEDEYQKVKDGHSADRQVVFSEEEREQMLKLPKKEYILNKQEQHSALLNLVDIIFAYAYNHRTTQGENTVESGWTICKLSGTLCWLDTYSSLKDVAVSSFRRCLCYPLYRHWKLTYKVFRDVKKIFTVGRKRIMKCLLETHRLLYDTDQRYILNDLYITDYCVWIQGVSSKVLDTLMKSLFQLKIKRNDVGFDLELLEHAAHLAFEEEQHDFEKQAKIPRPTDSEKMQAATEVAKKLAHVTISQSQSKSEKSNSVITGKVQEFGAARKVATSTRTEISDIRTSSSEPCGEAANAELKTVTPQKNVLTDVSSKVATMSLGETALDSVGGIAEKGPEIKPGSHGQHDEHSAKNDVADKIKRLSLNHSDSNIEKKTDDITERVQCLLLNQSESRTEKKATNDITEKVQCLSISQSESSTEKKATNHITQKVQCLSLSQSETSTEKKSTNHIIEKVEALSISQSETLLEKTATNAVTSQLESLSIEQTQRNLTEAANEVTEKIGDLEIKSQPEEMLTMKAGIPSAAKVDNLILNQNKIEPKNQKGDISMHDQTLTNNTLTKAVNVSLGLLGNKDVEPLSAEAESNITTETVDDLYTERNDPQSVRNSTAVKSDGALLEVDDDLTLESSESEGSSSCSESDEAESSSGDDDDDDDDNDSLLVSYDEQSRETDNSLENHETDNSLAGDVEKTMIVITSDTETDDSLLETNYPTPLDTTERKMESKNKKTRDNISLNF